MHPVGPLAYEEALQLIQEPASRAGMPFSEEECEWVLRQAGRHPFFIQRVCHYLFEEKVAQNGQPINRNRIKIQAYNELQHHFEDSWGRLDEAQQDQLRNEAQRKGERERILPELSESGLFRKFVRDKYQILLFHMNIQLVEDVLDDIDDFKVLGESDLRHLKSVSQRLKNNGHSSILERGAAVRGVLTDAFESLHGVGLRSDTAPGWELYNILYYRYFKHHLKNEQIVGRLGLSSTRKFYRQRQRAIETLFNNLIEMEMLAGGNDED
jgi:hypothetical protein